jgi:hypothetical protein
MLPWLSLASLAHSSIIETIDLLLIFSITNRLAWGYTAAIAYEGLLRKAEWMEQTEAP